MHNSLTRTQQIGVAHFLCHNRQKIVDIFRGGTSPGERRDTYENPIWPARWMPWDEFQGEGGELR
jgi:hypothetical protein